MDWVQVLFFGQLADMLIQLNTKIHFQLEGSAFVINLGNTNMRQYETEITQ